MLSWYLVHEVWPVLEERLQVGRGTQPSSRGCHHDKGYCGHLGEGRWVTCYPYARSTCLIPLLTATLPTRYYDHPHFPFVETEAQGDWVTVSRSSQLVSFGAAFHPVTSPLWAPSPLSHGGGDTRLCLWDDDGVSSLEIWVGRSVRVLNL